MKERPLSNTEAQREEEAASRYEGLDFRDDTIYKSSSYYQGFGTFSTTELEPEGSGRGFASAVLCSQNTQQHQQAPSVTAGLFQEDFSPHSTSQ